MKKTKNISYAETPAKVDQGCRSAGIGCVECKMWPFGNLEEVREAVRI